MQFFKKRIYADAAAGTPLSKNAMRELVRLLPLYGNAGALHKEAVEAKKEIEQARTTIAKAIGAHADEIVFTASGTEANNLAIAGTIRQLLHRHGPLHAITSSVEHQSVLEPLRSLEREGLTVTRLPVDEGGSVSPQVLREAITDKTVFVSIQLVNSEIGTVEPVRECAKEIRHAKKEREGTLPLYFHTDASQAPLWVSVSVEKLGVDMMTLDAQKVLGPKGVGALYVRRGVVIESIMLGGTQERNLRGGTPNTPLIGSFAVALHDAQEDVERRAQGVAEIRDFLIADIVERLPDAVINGTQVSRVANNVNVSIPNLDAEMAVIALDREGIAVSTRSACNTGDEEPSHVIKAIGVPKHMAKSAIRITLLPDISRGDARHIAHTLEIIAKRYRSVVE